MSTSYAENKEYEQTAKTGRHEHVHGQVRRKAENAARENRDERRRTRGSEWRFTKDNLQLGSRYSGSGQRRLAKNCRSTRNRDSDSLAEKSGVSKTTIMNWESGTFKPIVSDTFLKLAEALEVNVRTLMPKE